MAARLVIGDNAYELDSFSCQINDATTREGVTVFMPASLEIPNGHSTGMLSISINEGEEFSNAVPIQLYSGTCGVISRSPNGVWLCTKF